MGAPPSSISQTVDSKQKNKERNEEIKKKNISKT
jgi:hypothetical protein